MSECSGLKPAPQVYNTVVLVERPLHCQGLRGWYVTDLAAKDCKRLHRPSSDCRRTATSQFPEADSPTESIVSRRCESRTSYFFAFLAGSAVKLQADTVSLVGATFISCRLFFASIALKSVICF